MAKLDLTSHQRSTLRAAAHSLRPVVQVGDRGLSESVLKEIDQNLSHHELIKVRIAGEDRTAREALQDHVCNALECALVHHLGRTLILYRPQPEQDDALTTRAVRKPSQPYTPKKLAAEGLVRTKRGRTIRPASKAAAPAARPTTQRRGTASSSASPATPHNIPRRTGGSSLTLRAGVRRNSTRRHK